MSVNAASAVQSYMESIGLIEPTEEMLSSTFDQIAMRNILFGSHSTIAVVAVTLATCTYMFRYDIVKTSLSKQAQK